ncbi:hypothetical protein J7L06_10140 [Candidatus Bathyarchaeota archaeon]|nr:hypothetical protein [Candidatus Bathyarchaeota archaeon]
MKSISCRKKGGISSVIGMLIVAAMLFTVVIPLFLYVNEVNTVYNIESDKMDEFDHERSMESLSVVAYPVENGSELNVYVYNGAALTTEVIRVWVTDIYNRTTRMYNVQANESMISPASDTIIHHINVTSFGETKLLKVEVVTRRGNVFSATNNPIYISNQSEPLPFNIQLCFYTAGETHFERTVNVTYVGPTPEYQNWNVTFTVYQHIPGNKGVNVYSSVGVPTVGPYLIQVYRNDELVYEVLVEVTLQVPIPWVFIPED